MEHILEKEKMDAFKALADTNMDISKAKNLLLELKGLESSFVEERGKKVALKVTEILEESRHLLSESVENYRKIHDFQEVTSSFSSLLVDAHEKFTNLLDEFNERDKEWEESVKKQLEEIGMIRGQIKSDQIRLENDRQSIERREKRNKEELILIESRQEQIKSALKVLKEKK